MNRALETSNFEKMTASQQTKHIVGEAIKMTRGVAHQSRTLFEINKAAGIANAIINTHRGVTTALAEYPPPLSFVMAGLQLAAGLAEVQAIRSASFGGGSSGGGTFAGGGPVPTPPSDFATAPNVNSPEAVPQILINVEGNVFANEEWREAMIEQLQQALDNDEISPGFV